MVKYYFDLVIGRMTHSFCPSDWQVPAGQVTGIQSYQSFQSILGNASLIDTGFIVLQHDLFVQTVDLAVGYTLQAALSHTPPLTVRSPFIL